MNILHAYDIMYHYMMYDKYIHVTTYYDISGLLPGDIAGEARAVSHPGPRRGSYVSLYGIMYSYMEL